MCACMCLYVADTRSGKGRAVRTDQAGLQLSWEWFGGARKHLFLLERGSCSRGPIQEPGYPRSHWLLCRRRGVRLPDGDGVGSEPHLHPSTLPVSLTSGLRSEHSAFSRQLTGSTARVTPPMGRGESVLRRHLWLQPLPIGDTHWPDGIRV